MLHYVNSLSISFTESIAADYMTLNTEPFSPDVLPYMLGKTTRPFTAETQDSKSSRDLIFKQEYLKKLKQRLHEEKDTMPLVKRTALEHTIDDLQQAIETPADKIRHLQEQIAEFQQRADNFPADSTDYKIIAHSIDGLRNCIKVLQAGGTVESMEQSYRDQVQAGSDSLGMFVDEQPKPPIL